MKTLRSALAIIPQDPFIFTDNLRQNLDPLGTSTDDQLWQALEDVELKRLTEKLDGGLDHYLTGNGQTLSVGDQKFERPFYEIYNFGIFE